MFLFVVVEIFLAVVDDNKAGINSFSLFFFITADDDNGNDNDDLLAIVVVALPSKSIPSD